MAKKVNRHNLIGMQFGKLTVVAFHSVTINGFAKWKCKCECGGPLTIVHAANLRNGHTKSCGCNRLISKPTKHGHSGKRFGANHASQTYCIWRAMKARCHNPKNKDYLYYGGRGITVDPRWEVFANFLEDMGEKPEGRSIDRIDNNGNYMKSNCRWATPLEQSNNRRPRNIKSLHGVDEKFISKPNNL